MVSFINSQTSVISSYLRRILSPVRNTDYTIKNSCKFSDFTRDKILDAGDKLASFDIVLLFPKIPIDLVVKVAEETQRRRVPGTKNFFVRGGYNSSAVFLPQNHAIYIQRHLLSAGFWYSCGIACLCCHCQYLKALQIKIPNILEFRMWRDVCSHV